MFGWSLGQPRREPERPFGFHRGAEMAVSAAVEGTWQERILDGTPELLRPLYETVMQCEADSDLDDWCERIARYAQ
jgi:hypothetical protein